MKENNKIYVTKPYLPPLEEFIPYLEEIWENRILTNGGPFHKQLEDKLCQYLGVKYISLFSNGTLALITALQALRITGEVITSPYSFVATSHALYWNGIKPIFVDIDPLNFNINPDKIEAAITPHTTAIMPVHVYGNPCDTDKISIIAEKYNLRVIYDAAHAFGVKNKYGSILRYGDLSILSFHATKVFNTFEGGAIISHKKDMKAYIDNLKNFGYIDEVTIVSPGINSKMSELNSAVGLMQLKYIDRVIENRKLVDDRYRAALSQVQGIRCMQHPEGVNPNYSYFPILVEPEYGLTRDELFDKLRVNNIFARRYFYPLISDFPMYRGLVSSSPSNLPVSKIIASQVICLPIYPELTAEEQDMILSLIAR